MSLFVQPVSKHANYQPLNSSSISGNHLYVDSLHDGYPFPALTTVAKSKTCLTAKGISRRPNNGPIGPNTFEKASLIKIPPVLCPYPLDE